MAGEAKFAGNLDILQGLFYSGISVDNWDLKQNLGLTLSCFSLDGSMPYFSSLYF